MFRATTRLTSPLVAGALAFALVPRKSQFESDKTPSSRVEHQIKQSPEFQALVQDDNLSVLNLRKQFPKQHHNNLVTAGLLYGDNLFEMDPIVFTNSRTGQLYAFHYLGLKLVGEDGNIHNGITATLLDEGLCAAGFGFLPSKKGVTARLSIDFADRAPANAPVLLSAQVVSHNGRKVVIDGKLQTLNDGSPPVTIATASCVLIEPKWFKYFSWFQFI